jgi:hypothetical protein
MTNTSVAGDITQTRTVLRHLPAKLTFDGVILIEQRGDPCDFVFTHLASVGLRVDPRLMAQLARGLRADAVQVRQRNDRRPVIRNINTLQTWHTWLLDARGKPRR